MIAIVDSGPLFAAVDAAEPDHGACVDLLESGEFELVVPVLVVAEVCHFIGTRLGATSEASFLRGLEAVEVEAPSFQDWAAIAEIVERYSDFPLGTTDASIMVLAERLGTDLILTLDTRHFRAVRMSDGRPFRLLPE